MDNVKSAFMQNIKAKIDNDERLNERQKVEVLNTMRMSISACVDSVEGIIGKTLEDVTNIVKDS